KWSEDGLTAIAPTWPNFQWRTPIIAATMILSGEEVPSEWILPQPPITEAELDQYVQENMPPQHYALCGCEDMPGYPENWGGGDESRHALKRWGRHIGVASPPTRCPAPARRHPDGIVLREDIHDHPARWRQPVDLGLAGDNRRHPPTCAVGEGARLRCDRAAPGGSVALDGVRGAPDPGRDWPDGRRLR